MELTEELQAEEHEVFYTDDFAMHDVAAGGRVAMCMGCGADVGCCCWCAPAQWQVA